MASAPRKRREPPLSDDAASVATPASSRFPTTSQLVCQYFKARGVKYKTTAMKLVYYAHALSLAIGNHALYQDKIMKWEWGPVPHGAWLEVSTEEKWAEFPSDMPVLSDEVKDLLDTVWTTLPHGKDALVDKSHTEDPWKKTEFKAIIPQKKIIHWYKSNPKAAEEASSFGLKYYQKRLALDDSWIEDAVSVAKKDGVPPLEAVRSFYSRYGTFVAVE